MQIRNTQPEIDSRLNSGPPMRMLLVGICLTVAMVCLPAPAHAADWMFRRSYYSHELPPSVAARYPRPRSRSAYRIPYARGDGFAVRGGYRLNRIYLQSGNSTDTTYIYENWFGFRD